MSESSNTGSESGNDEFDEFDVFDEEVMGPGKEAMEKEQNTRIKGIAERINGMRNGLSLEADRERRPEPETPSSTQSTQPQRDASEEIATPQLDQGGIESTTTDSLETLQRNWKMGGMGESGTTEPRSPPLGPSSGGKPENNILGIRNRAHSPPEKTTKRRKSRRGQVSGLSGRRSGKLPSRKKNKFMPPGRPHVFEGLEASPGAGKGIHVESPETGDHVPVRGSVYEHVEQLDLHLHGLVVRAGTTATGADRSPETDATGRVFGLIPESIRFVRKMAENAYLLNRSNLDGEDRPFQFGVVNVLGREDHAQIMRSLMMARDKTDALHRIIEKSGAPAGTKISTVLYNEMGQPFAFGVKFPDRQFMTMSSTGPKQAQHLIFIHSTKAIGGGKSDEKLSEGDLPFECTTLSQEFEWWMSSLAVTGGKIGGLDTTIGGTSRTARYALMAASMQPRMFAKGALESIGVDHGDWVATHLRSESQVYRANLATSILRSAYGEAGKRLKGVDVELIDRQDFESRLARELRSSTAILRSLFLGNPDLMPFKGDISDEIWSRTREQGITESEWMEIVDKKDGTTWKMARRTELSTSATFACSEIERMANGEGNELVRERIEKMMQDMRSLVTENPSLMSNGGFATLTFYVPENRAEGRLTNSILSRSGEIFASALTSLGCPKVLTRILPSPGGYLTGSSVLVSISEEHAGTNLLMASNKDSNTHSRRTIIQNHKLSEDQRRKPAKRSAYSFRKILDGVIKAHEASGHPACEKDARLIRAFYRYVYGDKFGYSKVEVGGSNRPIERLHGSEEYI